MKKETTSVSKQWMKPELIILVRNKPQEAVLTGCKTVGSSGYHGTNNACLWEALCHSVCSATDPS